MCLSMPVWVRSVKFFPIDGVGKKEKEDYQVGTELE
jgi:hypothetical protein